MRIIGWWLVPIAWVAMTAVDWLIYGTPLAWGSQASPTAPFESFLTLLLNPTVGVVVGVVLLAPVVLRGVGCPY